MPPPSTATSWGSVNDSGPATTPSVPSASTRHSRHPADPPEPGTAWGNADAEQARLDRLAEERTAGPRQHAPV